MTVSYRMSWDQSSIDTPTLEVITVEKYRCLAPLSWATEDFSGRGAWFIDPDGRGKIGNRKHVAYTVEEMLAKGWVEKVEDD